MSGWQKVPGQCHLAGWVVGESRTQHNTSSDIERRASSTAGRDDAITIMNEEPVDAIQRKTIPKPLDRPYGAGMIVGNVAHDWADDRLLRLRGRDGR